MWTLDVYAKSMLPPTFAMLAVAGSLMALVAGVVTGFVRGWRRDVLAEAAEASVGDKPPPLADGRDVVLSGVVRHSEDHEIAVKVSVTQEGSEAESSGSWSYSWTEIDREIVLAPFFLELQGGDRVLVAPPKDVAVADALDQKVWIDRNHRVLSAELVPGERIYARGRLERSDRAVATSAYRDVQWGWTLRPSGGQMLLSSEPLGLGLRQRAAFHRRFARIAIGCLLVTQVSLVFFYSRLAGRTEQATVTRKGFYQTTDSDGHTDVHDAIEVRGHSIELDERDYASLDKGTTVPIRFASEDNWELGASATIKSWHGALLVGAALGFWLRYVARRRSSRPWFRRKVNDSGPGRLPTPT